MAKYRMINTKFWTDNYISELNALDRYLFLYFLTNEHTNIAGIYEVPLRTISFETGIELDMLKKMIKRLEGKVYYINGWIYVKNFTKHQADNPSIKKGIEITMKTVPEEILLKIGKIRQSVPRVSPVSKDHPGNLNLNLNPNLKIVAKSDIPYSLKEEIQKLEDSKRRDLNIIALYFEYRKPDLQNREQYQLALQRHLKPAKKLVSFSDEQILKAIKTAEKEYKEVYTLETLAKILTK